jgi:hypothetical protein
MLDVSRLNARVVLVHVAIVGIFGVWWPYIRGIDFFDPVFLTAYSCLGVLFAGPAAAQAFIERPKSMRQALRGIAFAVLYGETMAIVILIAGIATAAWKSKTKIGVDLLNLAPVVLLGAVGSIAMAAVAAWIAIRFSPGAARQVLRIVFLALLFLFFFKSRWLPDVVWSGVSICAGAAILAVFAIRRRIH